MKILNKLLLFMFLPIILLAQIEKQVKTEETTLFESIVVKNFNGETVSTNEDDAIYSTFNEKYIVYKENGIIVDENTRTIEISVSNFGINKTVSIDVVIEKGNTQHTLYSTTIQTNLLGSGSKSWVIPTQDMHTGKCRITARQGSAMSETNFFIYEVITGKFPKENDYSFRILYGDQFSEFNRQEIDNYAICMKEALINIYSEEINNWNFPSPKNIDLDNTLDVYTIDYMNAFARPKNYLFSGKTDFQYLLFGYPIINEFMNVSANYTSIKDVIHTFMCHEFFHAVQFNYSNIWKNWWNKSTDDWDYMMEGQARFIQTVFMEKYSSGIQNEEFKLRSLYYNDANDYIWSGIQNNKSLKKLSYYFTIFWRFLFENNKIGDNKERLSTIKTILEEANKLGDNAIVDGQLAIDNALKKVNGKYLSFTDVLKDFSKGIYLNDPKYGNWDPNPTSFDLYDSPYIVDSDLYGITDNIDLGKTYEVSNNIPSSFSMDYLVYTVNSSVNKIYLSFNGDPNSNGNMADFFIRIMRFEGENYLDEITGIWTDLIKFRETEFDISSNIDKIVVTILRTDPYESSKEDDYTFAIKDNSVANNDGIDVALVLDRSGSMGPGYNNYMDDAKLAAKNFVGLMQIGDNLSINSFSGESYLDFPFTNIASENIKTEAQNAIDNISLAWTGTSISNGILGGQDELNKSTGTNNQGMILLTDGEENRSPGAMEIIQTIPDKTDIYTIGLGPNSDQVLLKNIAEETGAFYSYSPTTADLQNIYNAIRAGLTGQQIIQTITSNINPNQNNSHSVTIDNTISNITFTATWGGSDLDLTLVDPNGSTIDRNNVNNFNGFFTSGNTYEYYVISDPVPGEWKMKVLGVDVPHQDYEYSVSASANTNLILATSFDQQLYGNGWPILITAELKENEKPTTGAQVFAEVTIPTNPVPGAIASSEMSMIGKNGSDESETVSSSVKLVKKGNQYFGTDGILYYDAEMIQLFDDGQHNDRNANDGYYAATFTNTTQPGSYTFKVTAEGNNQAGQKFTRQSTQSTVVDPVQTPSIPILVSPSDGSDVNPSNVKFEWQASINGETYTLQVSEDQTFATVNIEETNIADLTKTLSNLEKNKTYYWRVSATNSSGTSGWSQVWSFTTTGLAQFSVSYTISVESTCMENPYQTQEDVVKTGESITVVPFTLPQFASTWQPLYDALVGTKFTIENGALDENIELDIRAKQLDCENPGSYKDPSTYHNPLFMFLGIKVTGETSGVTELEDFYYFKNGKKAKLCIPHNQAFLELLNELNIGIDDIDFAYYLSDQYFKDGITQVRVSGKNGDVDSTCIYLEHFSQIAGGVFSEITDIENSAINLPTEYRLNQNYPNPFNPTTTISFSLPNSGKVSLKIYDVLGEEVTTLVDEYKNAGSFSIQFDASDLVSGIYFYKLQVNNYVETKKLILMK